MLTNRRRGSEGDAEQLIVSTTLQYSTFYIWYDGVHNGNFGFPRTQSCISIILNYQFAVRTRRLASYLMRKSKQPNICYLFILFHCEANPRLPYDLTTT